MTDSRSYPVTVEALRIFSKIKALALNAKPDDLPDTLAHIVRLCIDSGAKPLFDRNWREDASHENGNYECFCTDCEQPFIGHKRRVTCKACSEIRFASVAQTVPDRFRAEEVACILMDMRSPLSVEATQIIRTLAAQAPVMPDEVSLRNPNFVHINMLRGGIAKPTWQQIKHLYPEEFAQAPCCRGLAPTFECRCEQESLASAQAETKPVASPSNAELRADADKLSKDLIGRIAIVFGRHEVDARMVVTACSMVSGSYAFNIRNLELKRELVERWIETFRIYADVPDSPLPSTEGGSK